MYKAFRLNGLWKVLRCFSHVVLLLCAFLSGCSTAAFVLGAAATAAALKKLG